MRPILMLSTLLLVSAAFAAETPKMGPKLHLNLQVLVPVAATGEAGTPRLADELPADALPLVTERILALRFEPATRDGAPVASELSLSVPFTAQNIDGQVHYTVGAPKADPIARQVPRYPVEAIRDDAGAALMLRVELAPEAGPDRVQASIVATEFAPRRASRYKRQFEQAALDSLAGCCRLVETIDGQPLGGVMYFPITYFSNHSRDRVDMDDFNASHKGEVQGLPDGLRRAVLVAPTDG